MDKAILCIGGSELQLPTLRWAKEAGLRVLLSDANPNPPGLALADAFAQIPGNDVDALTSFARRQWPLCQIVSAYCGSDFGLQSVARINEAMGVTGLDPAVIETNVHKAMANRKLRQAGLPVPDGQVLSEGESPDYRNISFPVIVKPVEGSGSRGVIQVETVDELEMALTIARDVSPDVLIEQVVEGKHLDASGFFADGLFFPGGQLDRYFSPLPHRYPIWGCQPPDLDFANQQAIYDLLERAARVLGIDWGPVKADIIWGLNGPVLIEVTPRFHGDVSTSFVCPLAHGVSPIQHWMRWLASGETPDPSLFLQTQRKAGWAGIFPERAGTLKSVEGAEQALKIPEITQVLLRRGPGWRVKRIGDNQAVIGFLFAIGHTSREVQESLMAGLKRIRITIS